MGEQRFRVCPREARSGCFAFPARRVLSDRADGRDACDPEDRGDQPDHGPTPQHDSLLPINQPSEHREAQNRCARLAPTRNGPSKPACPVGANTSRSPTGSRESGSGDLGPRCFDHARRGVAPSPARDPTPSICRYSGGGGAGRARFCEPWRGRRSPASTPWSPRPARHAQPEARSAP